MGHSCTYNMMNLQDFCIRSIIGHDIPSGDLPQILQIGLKYFQRYPSFRNIDERRIQDINDRSNFSEDLCKRFSEKLDLSLMS